MARSKCSRNAIRLIRCPGGAHAGTGRGLQDPLGEGSREGSLLNLSLNVSPCVSYGLWFFHTALCIQCSSVWGVVSKSDCDPKGLACWGPASTRQTCLAAAWCELLPKPEIAVQNCRISVDLCNLIITPTVHIQLRGEAQSELQSRHATLNIHKTRRAV